MIRLVFSVYDSKAEAFTQPFFANTLGVAVRSFTAAVADAEHEFHKFAEDYTLFQIGIWDEQTGSLESFESGNKSITTAGAVLAQLKNRGDV